MNISLKWATDETEERKLREQLEKELQNELDELLNIKPLYDKYGFAVV